MSQTAGTIPEGRSAPARAKKLRFAIMCRGHAFPAWQACAIRGLLASGLAEPMLLIVEDDAEDRPRGAQAFRTILYRLYRRCWAMRRLKALRPVDLTGELGHLPVLRSSARQHHERAGGFRPEDVAELRRYRLDFIVQFAFPRAAGELLAASRFGIWAYHGHPEDGDGMVTAFWAYRQGRSTLPRALLRLAAAAQPGTLHRGNFRAGASCARSLDAALFGSADWCLGACRRLLLELEEGRARPPVAAPPPAQGAVPGNVDVLCFLARRVAAVLAAMFRKCFLLEYWNIGIVDAAIEQIVGDGAPAGVRWLAAPGGLNYCADPFALADHPGCVLVEEYSHRTGLGWISAMSLSGADRLPRRIAFFDQGTHRSYPFLFQSEGATFCVPESAADRRVDLYRAVRFPDLWQHARTLIENFPALDSSLFFHGGRWWLFCTSGEEGGEHKLYAWYAGALLGPWEPHRLNPLKCDVSSSRPAGRPFLVGNVLYRPAQDCSQTYGGAVVINRIVTLTPTDFAEIPAGRIAPAADSGYGAGLHTVCPLGSMTIIDGKRLVFDIRAPYFMARRRRPSEAAARRRASAPAMPGGLYQG